MGSAFVPAPSAVVSRHAIRNTYRISMKHDINQLMIKRNLDAIVVEGPDGLSSANAPWRYLTNGHNPVGLIVQRRDEAPQLIYGNLDQAAAEATGLDLIPRERWNRKTIMEQFPDPTDAEVEWYRRMLSELGVRGRVGWYGAVHAQQIVALKGALRRVLPGVEIVGEYGLDLISEARQTKDAREIERMADVGRKTCAVVQAIVDFLRSQRAEGDLLVGSDDAPITVGAVHDLIGRELARNGLEAPEGTIFAQGRAATRGHGSGDLSAPLRLGQSIIFDIYPRDIATGYFHDMTRTFALGYAPDDLRKLYDDVRTTFDTVMEQLKADTPARSYQDLTCRLLRERGHLTPEDQWPLDLGYFHSLGHGIGLDVHEQLSMSSLVDRGDLIRRGAVFTIEPGVYYPDRNAGVRIEDTVVCDHDGTLRSLTPFPYDLIIPITS